MIMNQTLARRLQIGVIGSAGPEEYVFEKPNAAMYTAAEELGAQLAQANCIVINGGKGGVMEAVCRGAKLYQGITVAETAGILRNTSNNYVDVEVVTGALNMAGPSVLVGMCDAVIALGGGAGTLQEICVAYRLKKPIILLTGYGGWTDELAQREYLDERQSLPFITLDTVSDAVSAALHLVSVHERNNSDAVTAA
jgi:uncharacterized protein (TIGR00725 family)